MRHTILLFVIYCLALFPMTSEAQLNRSPNTSELTQGGKGLDLNYLPHDTLPMMGAWFWGKEAFKPKGYKYFIDIVRSHSCYNLLTTSVRLPGRDINDIDVHNQVKLAAAYARKRNVQIALDLDVRLARHKFKAMYPDELQGSLWLKEMMLSKNNPITAVVRSIQLSDHMTGRKTTYISLQGSLLRVYSYHKTADGIDPNTLKDITKECLATISSKDSVVVRIPATEENSQLHACVMVSFTRLTPAVFAPHLTTFQRQIIQGYSDVPLAGGMKDEWGFPPSYPIMKMKSLGHFWYSKYYAAAYAKKTGGRNLLTDCLLMYLGVKGEKSDRIMAINNYMELNWERNSALEDDFYHTIKNVFGPEAIVTVHPTWWPYPNSFEYRKNGLDWWTATRDLAQTDETTPFAVRTALSKKWNSPVWYNQYYATDKKHYQIALWSYVLGGGRVNFHPFYPRSSGDKEKNERLGGELALLQGDLMRGESRVRLLDFISKSPLDCPVAVVFGHASTMNWAGPYFEELGMNLVDSLWSIGIPTDLIPTSEIENHSLSIDKDGWVRYGKQRYAAVILYNPEFEKPSTEEFFNQASKGQTKLFRIGNWTRTFNGKAFDGNAALPRNMVASNIKSVMLEVPKILKKRGIGLQTPATRIMKGFARPSNAPRSTGFCRLIDGTLIQVAGTDNVAGDVINSKMKIGKYDVAFNAIGVAAVRLDEKGRVQALAAGGLKYFKAGGLDVKLDEPVDVALWRTDQGEFKGVIQGLEGKIPQQLLTITKDWTRVAVPVPLSE